MTGTSTQARAEQLFALLVVKDDAGEPIYSEEDILGFFLVLVKSAPPEAARVPAVAALLERAAAMIGAAAPAEVPARLEAHFAAHPVPPALVAAFERLFREERAQGSDGSALTSAFLQFLGDDKKLQALAPSGAATGKNGPMLALLAHKTRKPADER